MTLPKIAASLITFVFFLTIFINQVHADLGDAQNGTVGGSDGGYTNGSGSSLGGGSYDPSSGNGSQDTFGSDFSGGGSDTSNDFAQMISEAFGLGNDAGTIGGIGGLNGPLSNINASLDQQGVTASYDLDNDPCLQTGYCPYPAPVLDATASCIGNQPVVNLSWSGIPQPGSANSWLGTNTFLIRSSQLQTALPVASGEMRIFPFAAMGYGTSSYSDTSRQYWRAGYTIPGSTEVTGTDENGNPTGTIEHPPIYVPPALVLTHTVNPSTFYYYRIYSTNASGAQVYKSELQGMTYDFSYTTRTPVSNIMAVYTPGCTGVTTPPPTIIPSPSPSPAATPAPTVTLSLTTPKGTFPAGGIPITVNQGDPVTINWQTEFASTVTASADPGKSDWVGSRAISGNQAISTMDARSFVLQLNAENSVGATSVSIQLNIKRPPAFIQTTGGDVHTNESIYMPPN